MHNIEFHASPYYFSKNNDIRLIMVGTKEKIISENDAYRLNGYSGEWEKYDPNTIPDCPGLVITESSAQHLADQLWFCGIRPNDAKGSAGQLSAVEKHLNDMRKIAFHQLKIPEK